MLRFILSQNLADEVTDVVSDNVNFWSWNTIVKYFEDSFPTMLDFLVKLVIAIIVLLVGRKVIKLVRKFIRKFLNKTNWDEGVKQFLDNICNVGLHFVLIMLESLVSPQVLSLQSLVPSVCPLVWRCRERCPILQVEC